MTKRMRGWVGVTVILCLYGGVKEIRPSTHYLTQYLEGDKINLTHTQVNNEVYPVWTYSYLAFLPVILLSTAFVRYKPVIVLEAAALVLTWCLLLWARGLLLMQAMQVAFGLASASDVAYYTYIYAQVPTDKYRQVTGYTHAAMWAGKFTSAAAAQALISSHLLDFHSLNYVSLTSVSLAFLLSLLLPPTDRSLYSPSSSSCLSSPTTTTTTTHPTPESEAMLVVNPHHHPSSSSSSSSSVLMLLRTLRRNLVSSYSHPKVLQWSVWWALGTCGSLQVGNYIQPLWEDIYPAAEHEGQVFHGAADAAKTLVATLSSVGLAHLHVDWAEFGQLTLGLVSSLDAALLFTMSQTGSIWLAYVTHCLFRASHQMLLTIASYLVAKNLHPDLHPLIFGFNTFVALLLNTILTVVIVDKRGLSLDPRPQFVVYSAYFVVIGLVFLAIVFWKKIFSRHRSKQNDVEDEEEGEEEEPKKSEEHTC